MEPDQVGLLLMGSLQAVRGLMMRHYHLNIYMFNAAGHQVEPRLNLPYGGSSPHARNNNVVNDAMGSAPHVEIRLYALSKPAQGAKC